MSTKRSHCYERAPISHESRPRPVAATTSPQDSSNDLPMIYILTAHYKRLDWLEIQLLYLERHMAEKFVMYVSIEGVDAPSLPSHVRLVPAMGGHSEKLNLLALEAGATASPDDLLIFLDGDAFPIADPMPTVHSALAATGFVAVQRLENLGDPQPHPLFAATTVQGWQRMLGDWSAGHPWINETGQLVTDPGGNLMRYFELSGQKWTALHRTHGTRYHPLWFGVYGGIIYHHGAGFRARVSRRDLVSGPRHRSIRMRIAARVDRVARGFWLRRRLDLADRRLRDAMRRDPEFWTEV